MQGVIKVNFNNARIKLPVLTPITVAWADNSTLIFVHDNSDRFETCKMSITINNVFVLETYQDIFEYSIPDTIDTNSLKIEVRLECKTHFYTLFSVYKTTITQGIICSDNVVCSEDLTCQE